MVRKYQRKTNRQMWDDGDMVDAIKQVVNKAMSLNEAARCYGIPRTTVRRRLKIFQDTNDMALAVKKDLGTFGTVFTPEQEEELVEYLQKMEARLHGLTSIEVRILVFQVAEKKRIRHPFYHGIAGVDWLKGFLARHKELILRKPEGHSSARALGFNQVVVDNFQSLLETVLELGPHQSSI